MKYLIIFFSLGLSFNLLAEDEQFITDSSVKIKSGYGNTSEIYFSYDKSNPGTDFRYKKSNCYSGKINKYKSQMKALEKQQYIYTNTEIYVNSLPESQDKIATFLVTYVHDTYEEALLDANENGESESKLGRPADYLTYRYFHFECELKSNRHVNNAPRESGKKTKAINNKKVDSKTKSK